MRWFVGGGIRFSPFFTLGSYFRGTKMVLISAEPYFRFVHFYAWFLFSREQNGSYFRAHIKNAKIWTREVLKRENEVRAKKWTFTVKPDTRFINEKMARYRKNGSLQTRPDRFQIVQTLHIDVVVHWSRILIRRISRGLHIDVVVYQNMCAESSCIPKTGG